MKIMAAHDGGSGCAFYRMLLPLEELNKQDGFDITFRSYATDGSKHSRAQHQTLTSRDFEGYDLVLGQRFQNYNGITGWRHSRKPGNRLAYEIDDDVFTITHENFQAYNVYKKVDIREAVRSYCRVSDLVTVSSNNLAEVFREFSPHVVVLPNYVPEFVLKLPDEREERFERTGKRVVGWAGGASHGVDINACVPGVRRFLKRAKDWQLHFIGTDYRWTFKVPEDQAEYRGWTWITDEPEKYYQGLDFDIGLCPLMDTTFGRSKTAIKALEYAARGIPCIASNVSPYKEYVVHGETGFLVKYDHEWLKYLELLAGDDDLRQEMGQAAHDTAAKLTIERNVHRWASAYTALFPSKAVS